MTTLPDLEPAALEAAPRGYLFELCYSHEHDRWSGPMYSECLPDAADVRNVVPLYAARSVPEAGKAVDAAMIETMAEKIAEHLEIDWDGEEPYVRSDSIEAGVRAALASVPAPSGAADELTAAVEASQPCGDTSPTAKLTESQAREILRLNGKMSKRNIARLFGISRSHVLKIHGGQNWKHLRSTGDQR